MVHGGAADGEGRGEMGGPTRFEFHWAYSILWKSEANERLLSFGTLLCEVETSRMPANLANLLQVRGWAFSHLTFWEWSREARVC